MATTEKNDSLQELKNMKCPKDGGRVKMHLEVGKTYRGTFWLNEYGEIQVKAEQKGTNPQGLSKHTEGRFYTIYTSKNAVQVRMNFPRLPMKEIVPLVKEAFVDVVKKFMLYNFEK